MAEIGHNGGPSLEPGFGFRKMAWKKARRALLPALPLEVVRIHVTRAKRLGLPYKTYATIRATSGRDIVGFLFSANALRLWPAQMVMPEPVAARLGGLEAVAGRLGAVYAPMTPADVLNANPGLLDAATRAPGFAESWSETRGTLRSALRAEGWPLDGVVLVSATAAEREWCGAAGLAGLIPADAFFDAA